MVTPPILIQRAEIWWADLPQSPKAASRRPVLILQSDNFNRSRIATIIAVVITSNLNLAQAPGNVYLPQKATGLPKDSVANISQIITLDKCSLTEKISDLPEYFIEQVEEGLRLVLGL